MYVLMFENIECVFYGGVVLLIYFKSYGLIVVTDAFSGSVCIQDCVLHSRLHVAEGSGQSAWLEIEFGLNCSHVERGLYYTQVFYLLEFLGEATSPQVLGM